MMQRQHNKYIYIYLAEKLLSVFHASVNITRVCVVLAGFSSRNVCENNAQTWPWVALSAMFELRSALGQYMVYSLCINHVWTKSRTKTLIDITTFYKRKTLLFGFRRRRVVLKVVYYIITSIVYVNDLFVLHKTRYS